MVGDIMEKVISLTDSIYNLVKKYNEVIEIMEDLGFEGMTNKNTINTVGRIMTLEKGAKFKSIDIKKIRDEFEKNNFIVKE
jgi:flagellar biosynthesis chaperone FliJ